MMLLEIAQVYASTIGVLAGSTVLLIAAGLGWAQLPHIYIRVVLRIQELCFPQFYPPPEADTCRQHGGLSTWPGIIERRPQSSLDRHRHDALASFRFFDTQTNDEGLFARNIDMQMAGVEAIIQDDLSSAFFVTRPERWTGLGQVPQLNVLQTAVLIATYIFRGLILIPIRFILLTTAFAFAGCCAMIPFFYDLTKPQKIWIAVTYCRLFCAGLGVIVRYHNDENRPKGTGLAVSNHLSPNDIQIIWANVPTENNTVGYTVTGQKHAGIIWYIQRTVERLCPAVWFERGKKDDRKAFFEAILSEARMGAEPVLVFPEGYCTNNSHTIQFRKALFEESVRIFPIAIRQDTRLGDNYWSEDAFFAYLWRVLGSWAIVYDITYLEAMHRRAGESSSQFAHRVQLAISGAAGVGDIELDGGLWYKANERQRVADQQRVNWSRVMVGGNEKPNHRCANGIPPLAAS